jgi:hypothetical protein
MLYIPFDAVFNALSESGVEKMAPTFLDTLLIKILSLDPIFEWSLTKYIEYLRV